MTRYGQMALVLAASMLVFAAVSASGTEFNARGNEPAWSIHKADAGITFRKMDGQTVTISPLPLAQKVSGGEVFRSTTGGWPFSLSIIDKICTDTMSGMSYPASVSVEIGAEKFVGCGGDPASLLHGEWLVEKIDGKPVVKESRASFNFGVDNQLSGNSSCNRYFGAYALSAEGLSVSELGSTQMMCDQPVMDQEVRFRGMLRAINRFEIGPNGALILRAKNGHSIVASRKG
jgi:heat shock protein HslJ